MLDAIRLCADENAHLWNRFTSLDSKSQGTAAVAGFLIGATLASAPKAIQLTTAIPGVARLLIGALAVVLMVATTLAIAATFVRPTRWAYVADETADSALELDALADGAERDQFVRRYYRDLLSHWRPILQNLRKLVRRKGFIVMAAQSFLLAGSVLCGALIIIVLIWS